MPRNNRPLIDVACDICRNVFTKADISHRLCCSPACSAKYKIKYERNRRGRIRNRRCPVIRQALLEQAKRAERRDKLRADAAALEREIKAMGWIKPVLSPTERTHHVEQFKYRIKAKAMWPILAKEKRRGSNDG